MSFSDRQYAWHGLPILLCITTAHAQTLPDAGALRQQVERQLPRPVPGEKKPLSVLPQEYKPDPGLSINVTQFRFAGNTLMTAEQLAPAVDSFLNRPLDFAGLQQAAAAVSDAYRAAGWLVRVYLPKQEIIDGVVTLQIVEGLFGKVRIIDPVPLRFSTELAQTYISAAQPAGRALNAAPLDRAMLLLDDLPGVTVSGNLAPGEGEAETDLALRLADEPLLNGEVGLDNAGSRSTGSEQLTVAAYLNSPFKIGDQLVANFIHAQGSDYLRLAYSAPVGYDGLRVGMNASSMAYDVITPEFAAAKIKGQSATKGLNIQYPLIRRRTSNLYFLAGYDDKQFDNEALSTTTTKYGVRNLNLGIIGNRFDNWGGGGANLASLNLTAGDVDLDGSPNKAINAATTQTEGNFTKIRYALSRQQALTTDLSIYTLLSGQFASKNLDSSEKFYLGGAYGVRAYPVNEGGGSEGTMLNLELRWRAMNNVLVTGFYDWGSVTNNKNNNFVGAPALNNYQLEGVGASVAWSGPGGLTFKATYARRTGDNPNRDAITGKDQDGSLDKDRFWLTVSLPFGYTPSAEQKAAPVSTTPAPTFVAAAPVVTKTPEPVDDESSDDLLSRDQFLIADGLRFDSARLTNANKTLLNNYIETDSGSTEDAILVIGHTDSTGPREYNQLLSLKRAMSAQQYLVKKGIDAKRIATRGDGEDAPVASNDTKQGRAKNRRIEIKVTSPVKSQEK